MDKRHRKHSARYWPTGRRHACLLTPDKRLTNPLSDKNFIKFFKTQRENGEDRSKQIREKDI